MKKAIGWSLVVLVVTLCLSTAVVMWRDRAQTRELRETLAQHEDAGYGTPPATLDVLIPRGIDRALQAQAVALMREVQEFPATYGASNWKWYLFGEPPPKTLLERLDQNRDYMERVLAVLRRGPVCISIGGWIPAGKVSAYGDQQNGAAWRLAEIAQWLFVESLLPAGRAAALDGFARLQRSILHDALGRAVVDRYRDLAVLALTHRGDVDGAFVDAWLAEPCRAREQLAEATRLERLVIRVPLARELLRGRSRLRYSKRIRRTVKDMVYVRWRGKRDMARLLDLFVLLEDTLRAADTAPPALPVHVRAWIDDGGKLLRDSWWDYGRAVHMAIAIRRRHRMARLGVRLLRIARARDRAPESEAQARQLLGAHAAMLDAGPWDVRLQYEKLAHGGRFRLRTDPKTPLPPAIHGTFAEETLRYFAPAHQDPIVGLHPALEMNVDPGR